MMENMTERIRQYRIQMLMALIEKMKNQLPPAAQLILSTQMCSVRESLHNLSTEQMDVWADEIEKLLIEFKNGGIDETYSNTEK